MFAPITAEPAAAPTTGLVRSARTPDDNVRWQGGMAWRQELCPTARGISPCSDTFGPQQGDGAADDELVYYQPVAFRVEDECSTRGQRTDDGRVRRQANAITSWFVARELELGELTRANPYATPATGGDATAVNHYLAEPGGTVVAGTHLPQVGLGLIEEAARDAMLGMDPWIHIPVRLVPLLGDVLVQSGGLLTTKTGARVVADSGYSGAGPFGAGTAEVQTVTITGSPTGGTFTLTFEGQTTAPIAYNANAAAVESALEALFNLGPANVTVTGTGPYTVTFSTDLGNVTQMTGSGAGLTGGSNPGVTVATTTPGVDPAQQAGDWLYATGPVEVRLDPLYESETVDYETNRILRVASRLFAARFDPCTLHAIQIAVPTPAA